MTRPRTGEELLAQFYDRTRREGDCLIWTGSTNEKGYGWFYIGGGKIVKAHRWIYGRLVRPLLSSEVIRHTCDTPPCVLIEHMTTGTNADNAADMVERRRSHNQKKTHCPRNHEYTDDNIYWHNGWRYCKTCTKARARAQQERNRHERQRDSGSTPLQEGASPRGGDV